MSMIADQYHQKLAEAEQMKGTAVKHLTEEIKSKIAELNAFGFTYKLVDGAGAPLKKEKIGRGHRSRPEGPCVVCQFTTVPAHDPRAHPRKSQKVPFTPEQLAGRKMVIVGAAGA